MLQLWDTLENFSLDACLLGFEALHKLLLTEKVTNARGNLYHFLLDADHEHIQLSENLVFILGFWDNLACFLVTLVDVSLKVFKFADPPPATHSRVELYSRC